MQNRLPKTKRAPERLRPQRFTALDMQVIALISRYRFSPTRLIQELLPNNPKVISRHLQKLYHESLINRFALPRPGAPGEFIYYLDNQKALELVAEGNGAETSHLDRRTIRNNREAKYFEVNRPGRAEEAVSRLPFIHHELMISRFHAAVEVGCQASNGRITLLEWRQGKRLLRSFVDAPKIFARGARWFEEENTERLPHEPDAFFRLYFPHNNEGERRASFLR